MRKKLLLFITTIGCYGLLFAQQNVTDSLQLLLRAHPQADTAKVNLIYELARTIRRNNPKVADSLIETGLSLSQQLNYETGIGKILIIKAIRYMILFFSNVISR